MKKLFAVVVLITSLVFLSFHARIEPLSSNAPIHSQDAIEPTIAQTNEEEKTNFEDWQEWCLHIIRNEPSSLLALSARQLRLRIKHF